MAKKTAARKKSRKGKAIARKVPRQQKKIFTVSQVEDMEKRALEKANHAISAIENAMAVWDATKEKPDDLRVRIDRLRYFHSSLSDWETKMLKAIAKRQGVNERIRVLREFNDIVYTYR